MTLMKNDDDYDKELLVRVPRSSEIKSGFSVEKRKDGHYYFTSVGLDCDEIKVNDLLQEVNGIRWEDFEDEDHANELLNDPALKFLYLSILSRSEASRNNESGELNLEDYETASEDGDNKFRFVSKVDVDDSSYASYETYDSDVSDGDKDEEEEEERATAAHHSVIENARKLVDADKKGANEERGRKMKTKSGSKGGKGVKKKESPEADGKKTRRSSVKVERNIGAYDMSPTKTPSTHRASVKVERNIGAYDMSSTKTTKMPLASPEGKKVVKNLPKPSPGSGWNKVSINHKLNGQSAIY